MLNTPNRRATALIILCAVLAYGASMGGVFVYDDLHSIALNGSIQSVWNIPSFFYDAGAFSASDARMYRPILLVTLALDAVFSGASPWAFKLTDVAIHALCAVLIYRVARRLRVPYRSAVFAGCLFAVHPFASEAINLTSARSNQLMVLGLLLALYCHFAAMLGKRGALWGGAVATVIACGSKETGIVIPGCLFVLEGLYALRRGWKPTAILTRLAPSIAVVIVYLITRRLVLGMATLAVPKLTGGAVMSMGHGRDLLSQLCTMMIMVPKFLAQCLVPVGQALDPFVPYTDDPWSSSVIAGVLFLAIITYLGLRAPKRRPAVFLGTTIAWACSMPWILIPLNQPAAEHRMYGALAGLALVFAGSVSLRRTSVLSARWALASVLALFAWLSTAICLDYGDPQRLWHTALAQNPYSVRAWCSLAQLELQKAGAAKAKGDEAAHDAALAQAIKYCETAVWHDPSYHPARSWAVRFRRMLGPEIGGPFVAVVHAEAMVKAEPRSPFYARQLARALLHAAELSGDRSLLLQADEFLAGFLELDRVNSDTFVTASEVRKALGDREGALDLLARALNRGAADPVSVLRRRFQLLVALRRFRSAGAVLQQLTMFGMRDTELKRLHGDLSAARLAQPPK